MDFDFTSLVTDRSQADVDTMVHLLAIGSENWTAEQLAAYNRAESKGAYNYTDFNRVSACMEYLDRALAGYGYSSGYRPVEVEPGRTLWQEGDAPTPALMNAYLDNVKAIRGVLELLPTTPEAPEDGEGLTIPEANAIEAILLEVELTIQRIVRGFARSNAFTFWSGYRPLPSAESDIGRNWAQLDAMGTGWRNWQVATWYLLLYGNLKAEGVVE